MTEQKLRKFKLIDREGYLLGTSMNKALLERYLLTGHFVGYKDHNDEIRSSCGNDTLIDIYEFQFFEEVFEQDEDEDESIHPTFKIGDKVTIEQGKYYLDEFGLQFIDKECTVKAFFEHSNQNEETLTMAVVSLEDGTCGCFRADMLVAIKPKTWQEQLCEEFSGNVIEDYHSSSDMFQMYDNTYSADIISFAKRVLELSGEK
ncbi:hypothetical protein NVP1101O_181 [Vibrio phage 1.101.O._10N.261.45.C6]|nr:hypothetical protein NVP1101O_181 [Vibrio phage 1.101.O._10N.261.45.C6]